MAFDPQKFIADNPDPDEAAPPAPQVPIVDRAIAAGQYALNNSIPGLVVRAGKSIWNDPAGSLQTTDDAVRAAANTVTFGGADRLAGYMSSGGPQTMSGLITGQKPLTYDEAVNAEVKKSEEARTRSPTASTVGDVAGSFAIPGLGAETLAARAGGGALARALAYGGTGAVTGAAQGAGNTYTGNLSDYLWNAGKGGGMGLVTGATGGAVFGQRPSMPPAAATIPEQRATTDLAYTALRANPTRYDPAHFAQRANNLEQNFYTNPNFVTEREFSPASFRTLDRMREPQPSTAATGGLTPGQIDLSRQLLKNADTRTDKTAAGYVRRGIDDFVENPPVGAVLPGAGNAQSARDAAAQALLARQSHAGAERSQISENLRRKAEAEANSRNSGLNVEAKLRSAYADFTKPNVKTNRSRAQNAGFNADEIGAMEQFHSGVDTPLRNTIRYLGNLGGGGGGLGALAVGGVGVGASAAYASDDPRWYAAVGAPLAGLALRGVGNRIAQNNISALDQMIRMRNPTSQYLQMTQPRIPGGGSATNAKATRDLIAIELAKRQGNTGE